MEAELLSSCILCRCVFPTDAFAEGGTMVLEGCLPPIDSRPFCPRCGSDEVVAGGLSQEELERRHVVRFRGLGLLVEALRCDGVAVHGHGRGMKPQLAHLLEGSTNVLVLGSHETVVLVDAPQRERETWRIRIPTEVQVRPGDADPGRAARLHVASIAPHMLTEGNTLDLVEVGALDGNEPHRAVWVRSAVDVASAAKAIKAILRVETIVTAEPEDGFWDSFGDTGAMEDLAASCVPPFARAEVTPWGITLRGADGRAVAVVTEGGHGTFHLAVQLPSGHGAKAARRASGAVLRWFEDTQAAEWREHGFTGARLDGSVQVAVDGGHRWVVLISLTFSVGSDVVARLGWACERAVIENA